MMTTTKMIITMMTIKTTMTAMLVTIIITVFTCGGPLNRMDLGWYFPSVGFSSSFPVPSFPVSRARSRADP